MVITTTEVMIMMNDHSSQMAAENINWACQQVVEEIRKTQEEMQRPFYLLKPQISLDGNQYCFLYGDNPMEGVAGYGDTPAKAAGDFDNNFYQSIRPGAT